MIALVLASALAATPRPLPTSESGLYVPRLDKVGGVIAFMERAGKRSVLLRPSTWFSEFHPLLYVDFSSPESLTSSGIALEGSATVSRLGDGRMSCVDIADAKVYEHHTREKLSTLGTVWEGKVKGVPVIAAKTGRGRVVAGQATKGTVSCAFMSPTDAKPLMEAAAAAVSAPSSSLRGPWAAARKLPGELVLVTGEGTAGITGDASSLTFEGLSSKLPIPLLAPGGQSPYADLAPAGVMAVSAVVPKQQAAGALHGVAGELGGLCDGCSEAVSAFEKEVAPELTGHMAFGLRTFEVKGRLRTKAQKFFAAKQAWLVEVSNPARVQAALQRLSALKGASASKDGVVVPLEGGEVRLGLHDRHLYLANDAGALDGLWEKLPQKPARAEHGLQFTLNPGAAAKALSAISLFDVVGSAELAGLFAAGTELGPLLDVTDSVTGWADGGKDGHRFGLTWKLR